MEYKKVSCPNCNGKGEIPHYHYNCQGVCFRCCGKGYIMERVYTEKELETLNKKKALKEQLSIKELRGYKNTDIIYVVAEENTFDIKAQLKQDGAIWNNYIREWIFENDNLKDIYNLVPVKYEVVEVVQKQGVKKIKVDRTVKTETINNTEDITESIDDIFKELGW